MRTNKLLSLARYRSIKELYKNSQLVIILHATAIRSLLRSQLFLSSAICIHDKQFVTSVIQSGAKKTNFGSVW
jgi:hypothetical protein